MRVVFIFFARDSHLFTDGASRIFRSERYPPKATSSNISLSMTRVPFLNESSFPVASVFTRMRPVIFVCQTENRIWGKESIRILYLSCRSMSMGQSGEVSISFPVINKDHKGFWQWFCFREAFLAKASRSLQPSPKAPVLENRDASYGGLKCRLFPDKGLLAAEFHTQQSESDEKQASQKPETVGEEERFFPFDLENF